VDSPLAPKAIATVHPSSILRAEDRELEYREFVRDLEKIANLIKSG
jgi:uracil-DNA glycosylase